MKKIDQKTLEKFAKEKNIDKNKVEKIAEGYKNKSEDDHIQINRFYEFYSWIYPDNSLEVVGSIYKNPELLEKDK